MTDRLKSWLSDFKIHRLFYVAIICLRTVESTNGTGIICTGGRFFRFLLQAQFFGNRWRPFKITVMRILVAGDAATKLFGQIKKQVEMQRKPTVCSANKYSTSQFRKA